MNKIIKTLFIVSIVILKGCTSNNVKTETELLDLKGKVKSVSYTYFKAVEKFGEIAEGERIDGIFSPQWDMYFNIEKDDDFLSWEKYIVYHICPR